MFLIFYLSALAAFELQRLVGRYAPSNVLARQIRAHGGIHAVIAAPIVAGASVVCAGLAEMEEHTSELQSLMRISYAVFCLKKKNKHTALLNNVTITTHTGTKRKL